MSTCRAPPALAWRIGIIEGCVANEIGRPTGARFDAQRAALVLRSPGERQLTLRSEQQQFFSKDQP
jgi:hypothetical protein